MIFLVYKVCNYGNRSKSGTRKKGWIINSKLFFPNRNVQNINKRVFSCHANNHIVFCRSLIILAFFALEYMPVSNYNKVMEDALVLIVIDNYVDKTISPTPFLD